MKKQFLIIILTCLCFTSILAQTTQEEYNYITKGYKVQIESGLDMKKGYTMVDYGVWSLNHGEQTRLCEFKGLVRAGQSKPCAILMLYKRTDIANGVNYYVCIPSNDAPEEIWSQTLKHLDEIYKECNIQMAETMVWALMKFGSYAIAK